MNAAQEKRRTRAHTLALGTPPKGTSHPSAPWTMGSQHNQDDAQATQDELRVDEQAGFGFGGKGEESSRGSARIQLKGTSTVSLVCAGREGERFVQSN